MGVDVVRVCACCCPPAPVGVVAVAACPRLGSTGNAGTRMSWAGLAGVVEPAAAATTADAAALAEDAAAPRVIRTSVVLSWR